MKIPERIALAGITITTVYDKGLANTKKCVAEARYSQHQIALDDTCCCREHLEQAYVHELVHWIFYLMGEDDLRNNEKLVDVFAHFTYQAIEALVKGSL